MQPAIKITADTLALPGVDNAPFCRRAAWVYLLLLAGYSEVPGTVNHDTLALANRWRWRVDEVDAFLSTLLAAGLLEAVGGGGDWSAIVVADFSRYTGAGAKRGRKAAGTERTTSGPMPGNDGPVVYSRFYDAQLARYADNPEMEGYTTVVRFLHSLNDDGRPRFPQVLSLPTQIGYRDYLTLKRTAERCGKRRLREVLEDMENYKDLAKQYTSAFQTANNWLKTSRQ